MHLATKASKSEIFIKIKLSNLRHFFYYFFFLCKEISNKLLIEMEWNCRKTYKTLGQNMHKYFESKQYIRFNSHTQVLSRNTAALRMCVCVRYFIS
jgi:hypothetical protein